MRILDYTRISGKAGLADQVVPSNPATSATMEILEGSKAYRSSWVLPPTTYESHPMTSTPPTDPRISAGMKTRRAVLGEAYVDKATASVTPFTADFQDFITKTAWNDIWNRPGLDRRARSIVVLSITIGMRHWGEFRIHVRGALNNGLSRDEIKEILIQSAIYAGVPAANHAFKEASAVFAEMEGQ